MLFLIIGVVLALYFSVLLARQIKAKQWKVARLSAVIVTAGLAGIVTGLVMLSSSGDSHSGEITLEEYDQIQIGMTYKEVVDIIGAPGKKTDVVKTESGETGVTNYIFERNDGSKPDVTLYFKDDELIIKSQMLFK
ncbi:DUF3862 domain-containing protein [Saccharibacillus brassicae]|uniref:DUF3862 domain-containing protein n=1 Tax=Saccharibacillus brassicae TaxID=2583377 RepID=A0A4Y6V565_SACBS|nr:DUF3862 domain-containing protein [Saccharibacillus brassicae]QDH23435.1 DUF3862 domain-containing protein [Saccharibacillus brassicae]